VATQKKRAGRIASGANQGMERISPQSWSKDTRSDWESILHGMTGTVRAECIPQGGGETLGKTSECWVQNKRPNQNKYGIVEGFSPF